MIVKSWEEGRLYLDPGLCQPDLARELLPGEDVRVVGLREHRLQLLQLLQREGGSVAPLLPPEERLVVHVAGVAQRRVCGQRGVRYIFACFWLLVLIGLGQD